MSRLNEVLEVQEIRRMVHQGFSHSAISQFLSSIYPSEKGFSERSVRRYCKMHNIKRLTDIEIDEHVSELVASYGHLYGRSLMQGSIRSILGSFGGAVSQKRVSKSLQRVAPEAFVGRTKDILSRTNPIPYTAPYFGYKIHIDQNEKLGQCYGCTHVALIDGCSRFICGFASMPVKNPIIIYEKVFLPALKNYGIWEQLRLDKGQEFSLCIFTQELLKNFRKNRNRAPWKQTASTDNYVIERLWPEVNSRINYPVNEALNFVVETNDLDMSDDVIKHCLSWISNFVVEDAVTHFVNAWNHHRVPGPLGCVPISNMIATKNTATVSEHHIPTTEEAVLMYEQCGGRLSRNFNFGEDPLVYAPHAAESRSGIFISTQPSAKQIFSDVVHGDFTSINAAFECYYDQTVYLMETF